MEVAVGALLRLLGTVAGAILLLVGLSHNPQIVWMIVVGVILLAVCAGVYIFLWLSGNDSSGSSGGSGGGDGSFWDFLNW